MNKQLIRAFFIGSLVATSLSSCSKKETKGPEKPPELAKPDVKDGTPTYILDNYALVWNDEFNGTQLDLTKWNYRGEGSVRNLGTVNRNTISLDGKGNLLITVFKDDKGVYNIGQVSTDNLFFVKYGYIECRVKLQRSVGPHTALWLQSPTFGQTLNPAVDGVEIDIFEYHRRVPNRVFHNLHWDGYGDAHKTTGSHKNLNEISEGYHTFGVEWTENEYIFFINGKKSWSTNQAISKTNQFIILSSELTGWGGDPSEGTFPDAVTFDYVRVYKKK